MRSRYRVAHVLGLLFAAGFLSGCVEGACEYYYEYSFDTNYYCDNESGMFPFETSSDICIFGDGNHFHEGSTCQSIGYTQPGSVGYTYNDARDPSPYGYYGSGSSYGGGTGGGSGGGTSYNCDTVWIGDPNDVQVSTQCQTACVYYNAGGTAEGDYTCSIVAGWGATSDCTVCN